MINIRSIPTGPLAVNTYIVWYGEAGEKHDCVVIDPANSHKVMNELERLGLNCTAILITHGHFDHIMGVAKLRDKTGARVYINELDAASMTDSGASLATMIGVKVDPSQVDVFVKDNMEFIEAGIRFRVIHTPGHTKGGVCFVGDGVAFTGDTLFAGSIGRSDFPGGSEVELIGNIKKKLLALPDETKVYSGHGPSSEIGWERKCNPYLQW